MQSVLLNNYNAGAATTGAAGAAGGASAAGVAGGMRRHTEYGITNTEWMLNGSENTLCVYLSMRLDIRGVTGSRDFGRFGGIRDYYVRNEYGYEYNSSRSVGGVVDGRYVLDPWNRRFVVFPCEPREFVGLHGYEVYYSDLINRVGFGFGGGVVNKLPKYQGRHNVMLMTTTVNANRVYCVDILAGVYEYR